MREIKFRAWDKKLKKWVDIFTHKIGVQLTDVGFAMSTGWNSEDNPTWDFSKVEFDRYEFPQFTGLKDKNGKEIYEGDILTGGFVVTFYNGSFGFWAKENSIPEFFMLYRYLGSKEIIGNRFENPELLK